MRRVMMKRRLPQGLPQREKSLTLYCEDERQTDVLCDRQIEGQTVDGLVSAQRASSHSSDGRVPSSIYHVGAFVGGMARRCGGS